MQTFKHTFTSCEELLRFFIEGVPMHPSRISMQTVDALPLLPVMDTGTGTILVDDFDIRGIGYNPTVDALVPFLLVSDSVRFADDMPLIQVTVEVGDYGGTATFSDAE